jgi:glycerol-3-phosphate dehydrogenase
MATTLDDVLSRRTRARLLAAEASVGAASDTATLVGEVLGWTPEEQARQVEAYRRGVEAELASAGLTDTPAAAPVP